MYVHPSVHKSFWLYKMIYIICVSMSTKSYHRCAYKIKRHVVTFYLSETPPIYVQTYFSNQNVSLVSESTMPTKINIVISAW